MRVTVTYLALLILFSAHTVSAQEFNAGFVQGLWYSEEKVFVNDSVRIYVAIRNNTGSDLTGTVEFFDGDKRIDKKTVQALDGRIIESWADWVPTYGSHTLSANLTRIELHKVGSSTQAVEVTSALAEDILFVDYDTDKDNIGNEEDADDDGDSISDAQEKSNGTDPLVKNVIEKKVEATKEDAKEDELKEEETTNTQEEQTEDTSTPQGLEQYLTESPAESVLSGVTNYINTTKQSLDSYRTQRSEKQKEVETASTTKEVVNEDGFGAIERSTDSPSEKSTQPKKPGDGLLDTIFSVAGTLFNTIYTGILSGLSFVLAHPMFVQLAVLILILFFMIKFAAKVGQRPKKFK